MRKVIGPRREPLPCGRAILGSPKCRTVGPWSRTCCLRWTSGVAVLLLSSPGRRSGGVATVVRCGDRWPRSARLCTPARPTRSAVCSAERCVYARGIRQRSVTGLAVALYT